MSQEKVAKYKEEKANRKEIMKKQKRARMLRNSIAGVVLVAVVGWVGYSGVAFYIENLPRPEVEVNYTAISNYNESLTADDSESEDVPEGEDVTESEGTSEEGTGESGDSTGAES